MPTTTTNPNEQTSDIPIKKVDLDAFSKQELTSDITTNINQLEQLLVLSEDDYEKAKSFDLKVFGIEEYNLFQEKELKALLCKYIPHTLLIEKQHIKGISFHNQLLIPQLDENSELFEKELPLSEGKNNPIRTLCIKKHDEPLLRVYSPTGLSDDTRVLKIVILNAIIHDFGHGVIDYYFDEYLKMDENDNWQPLYKWITDLGITYGYGTPLTPKSAGYLVDTKAVEEAESMDERAMIALERAQEDFAEAFRLKCLDPRAYEEGMKKTGNQTKKEFIDKIWE
ncbi:MAG: hypothetical protein AB9915_02895 [Candidatus Dojkabacteria bacterium]